MHREEEESRGTWATSMTCLAEAVSLTFSSPYLAERRQAAPQGGAQGAGPRTRQAQRQARPVAYQQDVQISLEEAYRGAERQVSVNGRRLTMKIPAGARTGTKVRMAGAGPTGPDGKPSDLYLVIDVMPDPRFERQGDDLTQK